MKRSDTIKIGVLVTIIIAALFNFRQMFAFTAVMFNEPLEDMMHGWVIPFVSVGVIWTRRRELRSGAGSVNWVGVGAVVLCLILAWFGGRGGQSRLEQLAFIGLIWALPFALWGRAVERLLRFPAAYLLFTVPVSSYLDFFTIHLRIFSTTLATALLNGVGVIVERSGTALFSRVPGAEFNVDVADPCSGIRSLFAMMALMTIYAFVTQRESWKKWVLFACSIPVAMLANMVRVMSICLVATWFGQKVATGYYHDYSGFATFLAGVLLMLQLSEVLKRMGKPQVSAASTAAPTAAPTVVVPHVPEVGWHLGGVVVVLLLLSLGTFAARSMVPPPAYDTSDFIAPTLPQSVGNFTSEVPWFCHNPQCLHSSEESTLKRQELDGKECYVCPACGGKMAQVSLGELTDLPRDTTIIKRNYRAPDGLVYAFSVVIGGRQRNSIHRAELCMPAQGFTMLDAQVMALHLANGRVIKVRKIDAQRGGGAPLTLIYWFTSRERECCSHAERILLDVWDRSIHNRINRWVMLAANVVGGVETPESVERLEAFLGELLPQTVLTDR